VAIVMDGSGRWAQRKGLARTEGHGAGEVSLVDTTYGALSLGLKALTVFAFSTENWRRPVDEVRYLMNFNRGLLERRQHELHADGVRIVFSGRRDWRVPKGVLSRMDEAAELTKHNTRLTLNIAFNYGGRAEIVDAVRELVLDKVPAKKIDEKKIKERLYHPELPDPDLVIRTSGEYRISNFLLWEMAYAELVFTEVLWPDFRREDLFAAVGEYQRRDRRFGGVEE
jgi:undecaprenyl diphosphate synthase